MALGQDPVLKCEGAEEFEFVVEGAAITLVAADRIIVGRGTLGSGEFTMHNGTCTFEFILLDLVERNSYTVEIDGHPVTTITSEQLLRTDTELRILVGD